MLTENRGRRRHRWAVLREKGGGGDFLAERGGKGHEGGTCVSIGTRKEEKSRLKNTHARFNKENKAERKVKRKDDERHRRGYPVSFARERRMRTVESG